MRPSRSEFIKAASCALLTVTLSSTTLLAASGGHSHYAGQDKSKQSAPSDGEQKALSKIEAAPDAAAKLAAAGEFTKKYPKSTLADNAQYWIGESYYGLREFDQAIIEFDAVRRRYPQGEKVPAALLKQGYAFAELGEKVNARLLLQEIMEKFPETPEAAEAKMRLKSLES